MELLDGTVREHPALASLREVAQQLDQYYVTTRYPNGLPGGVPSELFTARQTTRPSSALATSSPSCATP
jgi:hypothetical protein